MLVFSNLAEQVKFKILNSSGDNDLRANIGTKTLMGGFIYGSKDSFNYDIRTIYPQGQHPTDPLFTNVWVKRNQ